MVRGTRRTGTCTRCLARRTSTYTCTSGQSGSAAAIISSRQAASRYRGGLLPNWGTRIIDSSRLLRWTLPQHPHAHTVPGADVSTAYMLHMMRHLQQQHAQSVSSSPSKELNPGSWRCNIACSRNGYSIDGDGDHFYPQTH